MRSPVPVLKPWIVRLADNGPFASRSVVAYRLFVAGMVILSTLVEVLRTVKDLEAVQGPLGLAAEAAAQLILVVDLGVQASAAVMNRDQQTQSRARALGLYLVSVYGMIDLLAVLPFYVEQLMPAKGDWDSVFGILRFVKLARYSPALEVLAAVVRREARPLQAATFILVTMLLGSSTMLYFLERGINANFSSIPATMWWSVATLTTVGYGDAVPVTGLGKLAGGCVAMLGIAMFALPASILATGFAEEMRKRDFLAVWRMVARVPFFSGLDADHIADITNLLKLYAVDAGDVVIRIGEIGDRMYFIVSGLLAADFGAAEPALLSDGDFFGEIAVLRDSRRTATVTARSRCQLLVLNAADLRRFIAKTPKVAEVLAQTARDRLEEQAARVE